MTDDPIAATDETITACPTCHQRVLIERDGSYRRIAELRYRAEQHYRFRYEQFVLPIATGLSLRGKQDWKAILKEIKADAQRCLGNSYLPPPEDDR